jgi:hypothetical protein
MRPCADILSGDLPDGIRIVSGELWFLYPSFEWAYKKISKAIEAMGEAGTRVAGAAEEGEGKEDV